MEPTFSVRSHAAKLDFFSKPLEDANVLERLYHVYKALGVPPADILSGMRKMRRKDPALDWEYALYHYVFEHKRVPKSQGFYGLRYVDEEIDGRVNYVVCARKGAFAFPEHTDPKYSEDEPMMPTIRAVKDKGLNVLLPSVFTPATAARAVRL